MTRIRFRTNNEDCEVALEDLNEMGSTTDYAEDMYGPDDIPDLDLAQVQFWQQISDDRNAYDPTRAKASLIRHPALKLAHRILVQIFFPREDQGTVSTHELQLLYAMTHGDLHDPYRQKPNFARWLMHKPLQLSTRRKCRIMFGGIVTRILKSDMVPAHLHPIDNALNPIQGETRLTFEALNRTSMFTLEKDQRNRPTHVVWIRSVNETLYLRVPINANDPDSNLLRLTPDIRDQNWNLPANTQGPAPRASRQLPAPEIEAAQEQQQEQPQPQHDFPNYHEQYMAELHYLRESHGRLDQTQNRIETSVNNLRTDFNAERELARKRYEEELQFRQEMREMRDMQRRMYAFHFPQDFPPPGPQ